MLNIRTVGLSVILVLILTLTVQLVTAGTEPVSQPENGGGNVAESQEASTELKKTYYIPEYRSQFGECLDVSIAELAACRAEGQLPTQGFLDECFDVSLVEVAACRLADQSSTP